METVIEKVLPVLLTTILFLAVVKIVIGGLLRGILTQLTRPMVLLVGFVLIASGIIPLTLLEDGVKFLLLATFQFVKSAHAMVLDGL